MLLLQLSQFMCLECFIAPIQVTLGLQYLGICWCTNGCQSRHLWCDMHLGGRHDDGLLGVKRIERLSPFWQQVRFSHKEGVPARPWRMMDTGLVPGMGWCDGTLGFDSSRFPNWHGGVLISHHISPMGGCTARSHRAQILRC